LSFKFSPPSLSLSLSLSIYIYIYLKDRLCGSDEFLAADPEVRVRFPALPDFLRNSALERGPLSLVSTTEELLGINSSGSGLET
jgi:hypothetical protein